MSKTASPVSDVRKELGVEARNIAGAISRMVITLTRKALWQFEGRRLLDNTTKETIDSEVWTGIGFYSRPASGANCEAIVAFIGNDPESPAAVALRDEGLRKSMAGDLAQDETAIFNSLVRAVATAAGKLRISTKGGTADKLPTWADYVLLHNKVSELAGILSSHGHAVTGTIAGSAVSGFAAPIGGVSPPAAGTGTTVLEAE